MKNYNFVISLLVGFLLLIPGLSIAAKLQQSSSQPIKCSASDLSFSLDDKDGYFNGMSQSGVLLALHNISSHACSVPSRPILSFEDAKHRPLSISLQVPKGMRPGPVIPPIVIPAGTWVTSEMRWVSSDVYEANNCISPAFITISTGKDTLRIKFDGYLCGPAGKNPTYKLTPFKLDSTYNPVK